MVGQALTAAADSAGLVLDAAPPTALLDADGRSHYRYVGYGAGGQVVMIVEMTDAAHARVRASHTFPLPFDRRTPMLHLRWLHEAHERLGTPGMTHEPDAIWPAGRGTCLKPGAPSPVIGPDVVPPEPVRSVPPSYTEAARKAGVEGRVHVRMIIERDGTVSCAEAISGLAKGLSGNAVEAARQWKFLPARQGGEPTRVFVTLPVAFLQR